MTARTPPVIGTLESALYAGDLDAALLFWRDVMGLTPFQIVPGRHVFLRVAPSQVLLIFNPAATEQPPRPDARLPVPPHGARGPGHLCFAAEPLGIEGWRARLGELGVAIEAEPTLRLEPRARSPAEAADCQRETHLERGQAAQVLEGHEQERLRAETEADLTAAGVAPLSVERLRAIAQDSPWESPEELDAFLADVYAARRRD